MKQFGPWHVAERAGGRCFSVAEHVQTKGNRLTEHYVCHVADGIGDAEDKARIMSAAPEAIEALVRIKETGVFLGAIASEMLNSALAKAGVE